MLASLVNVKHLVEVSGYPLLFVIVMAESGGVPIPGETALIAAAVLASQGKLQIELVIPLAAAAAIVGDNIGYQIGRKGGRWLLERPGRFPRPAHLGLVAGRYDPHALALVLPLERARRDLVGEHYWPSRLLPRPLREQRDRGVRYLRARRGSARHCRRSVHASPPPPPRRAA